MNPHSQRLARDPAQQHRGQGAGGHPATGCRDEEPGLGLLLSSLAVVLSLWKKWWACPCSEIFQTDPGLIKGGV